MYFIAREHQGEKKIYVINETFKFVEHTHTNVRFLSPSPLFPPMVLIIHLCRGKGKERKGKERKGKERKGRKQLTIVYVLPVPV